MHFIKNLKKLKYTKCIRCCHTEVKAQQTKPNLKRVRVSTAVNNFFRQNDEVRELKQYIPSKYLQIKRKSIAENLYLISPKVAKTIVSHLQPILESQNQQIICETNAGLGLIATELLESGVELVRLYETCPDFRQGLKDFASVYPDRVELFTRDIFNLERYAYMDKHDHANRVESMLKNVPKRRWSDEPVMTIIGSMPRLSFLRYVIMSLALQSDIANYGRMQIFAIMRPRHYAVLSASPKDNLNAYQSLSVLLNLLFDYELLDKFPRNLFLPWEPPPSKTLIKHYPANLEPDKMYLVKIGFKKHLPVAAENLLPLLHFVRQFYGKGSKRVIPTVEKWVPGCGLNIIVPKQHHTEYYEDMGIFTRFRELTPPQILSVFKELINHPSYLGSPFIALIENEAIKLETIETNLAEASQPEKNMAEDVEEKLDVK